MKPINVVKHSAAIAFVLFSSVFAISQDNEDVKTARLGLNLSPNLGWISPDNDGYSGEGVKLGLQYGLSMDFVLFNNPNYYLATGVKLSHIGGKFSHPERPNYLGEDDDRARGVSEANYSLRYVDVPFAIKLKTNEIGYAYYYGLFGLEGGVNIKAEADYDYTDQNGSNAELKDVDVKDDVSLFRADLVFGGGMERTLSGNTRIVLGIHYHNGFTNIVNGRSYDLESNGAFSKDQELKNRQHFVKLNIGITF
jgi:hypothetical protein